MKLVIVTVASLMFSGQLWASGSACSQGTCASASGSGYYNVEGETVSPQVVEAAQAVLAGTSTESQKMTLVESFANALAAEQISSNISLIEYANMVSK